MKAFDSYVAAACEISVQGGNKVKVHRIVAATDPGYAVNPAQIERQVAGSFVYGLSALFMQECTVKDGRIEQENFHNYNSMRIAQMPKVETIIMPTGGAVWGGIGEPTICVAAPAVLNAFFRATGQAHPLGAAEEPRHRAGVRAARGRIRVFPGNGFCRRCDTVLADRRQGRPGAGPGDRRQPAGRPVPAVPQRAVPGGALPGRRSRPTSTASARACPRASCG